MFAICEHASVRREAIDKCYWRTMIFVARHSTIVFVTEWAPKSLLLIYCHKMFFFFYFFSENRLFSLAPSRFVGVPIGYGFVFIIVRRFHGKRVRYQIVMNGALYDLNVLGIYHTRCFHLLLPHALHSYDRAHRNS